MFIGLFITVLFIYVLLTFLFQPRLIGSETVCAICLGDCACMFELDWPLTRTVVFQVEVRPRAPPPRVWSFLRIGR